MLNSIGSKIAVPFVALAMVSFANASAHAVANSSLDFVVGFDSTPGKITYAGSNPALIFPVNSASGDGVPGGVISFDWGYTDPSVFHSSGFLEGDSTLLGTAEVSGKETGRVSFTNTSNRTRSLSFLTQFTFGIDVNTSGPINSAEADTSYSITKVGGGAIWNEGYLLSAFDGGNFSIAPTTTTAVFTYVLNAGDSVAFDIELDQHAKVSSVPEPFSMAALGLGALTVVRKRRK